MTHVLITGAGGFIGGAVLRALAGRRDVRVRALVRSPARVPQGCAFVLGDLTAPETLRAALAGVDAILHAASYVGADPLLSAAVNHHGTAGLVAAAQACGVTRFVAVSTAAVYGNGPHRGAGETELDPAPQSPVSRHRLAGEETVRAAGGTVVRPHLVYGRGDRWFVPALMALTRRFGLVADGAGLLSTVSADALGSALAALAADPAITLPAGGILHGNHPEPVSVSVMVRALAPLLGTPVPAPGPGLAEALSAPAAPRRLLTMLGTDHWYRSERIWQLTGCPAGPSFPQAVAAYADWYREVAGAGQ